MLTQETISIQMLIKTLCVSKIKKLIIGSAMTGLLLGYLQDQAFIQVQPRKQEILYLQTETSLPFKEALSLLQEKSTKFLALQAISSIREQYQKHTLQVRD